MAYRITTKMRSKQVSTRKKITKKRTTTKKKGRVSKTKSRKRNKYIRKIRSKSYKNKKKRRSVKRHKGGVGPEIPFESDIEPIAVSPLIIDDHSITESQMDDLELELADNSWASHTPDQSMESSFNEGNTTREDYSDDEEDDDDEDPLNTAFHEDEN
jgi:hypothetical protein